MTAAEEQTAMTQTETRARIARHIHDLVAIRRDLHAHPDGDHTQRDPHPTETTPAANPTPSESTAITTPSTTKATKTPTTPTTSLPQTGTDASALGAGVGLLLVVMGSGALLAARRRR